MIRLMISDLDGTLLSHDKTVRTAEKQAILKAARQGVGFGMASGRMQADMVDIAREIGIEAHFVSQNGAFIHTAKGSSLREEYFNPETVRQIMELAPKYDLLTFICVFDQNLVTVWDDIMEQKQRSMRSKLQYCPDALERLGIDVHCSKLSFFGPIDRLLKLQTELQAALGETADTFISDRDCLDVMPPGISKGSGLGILLEHLGLRPEQVACIGDSFNDVSMFQMLPHSFAMAGSHPEVSRQARHTAESVADAIEWVLRYNREYTAMRPVSGE